jgi:hypothetical protein
MINLTATDTLSSFALFNVGGGGAVPGGADTI